MSDPNLARHLAPVPLQRASSLNLNSSTSQLQPPPPPSGLPQPPPPRLAVPRPLSNTTHDIQFVEKQLEDAALGPVVDRRCVTKTEYAKALSIVAEAKDTCRDANEYRAATEEYTRELESAQALTKSAEDELEKTRTENRKLRTEYQELQNKFTATDLACTKSLSQLSKVKKEVEEARHERDSLTQEMDYLLDEIDMLKENLSIQETNVETLKRLAERLQEDIAKYKKRQEETAEKHRIAVLRMEAELAKDVDELRKEYEAKEGELRAMIRQSEALRKQADQEWDSRADRLEKAKNDELQKLRSKIELLLREEIDSMRDRVRQSEGGDAAAAGAGGAAASGAAGRRSGGAAAASEVRGGGGGGGGARAARRAGAPLDLYAHTADVMTELSAGRSILSLEILAKGDEFRSPVYWRGGTPTHKGDLSSMDVGIRLSVDNNVLHGLPKTSSSIKPYTSTGSLHQEQQWAFKAINGAEVIVGMRILPPEKI